MTTLRRLLLSLLLASGLVLVFAGLSHALGFTVPGTIASVAVIAALLYAGSVWFAAPPAMPVPAGVATVLVFDRQLQVVAGPSTGASVLQAFPHAVRPEVESRCRAALRGESTRFTCLFEGRPVVVDASPVASASGLVLYGILIAGTGPPVPRLTATPAATPA